MALLSVVSAAAAVVMLGLYMFGGLETATAHDDPSPAGTQMRNILYTITPHEAQLVSDELGTRVQVRADLELHGQDEPVPVFDVGTTTLAHVRPGDHEMKFPELRLTRNPDVPTSHVQPHMPEEVLLTWPLPEEVPAQEVDTVRITVHQTEKLVATGEGSVLWVKDTAVIGTVDLPIQEA